MKVFTLRCSGDHEFEGWFPSAEESERQLANKMTSCPLCDSTDLTRVPSAPRLNLAQEKTRTVALNDQAAQALWIKALREIAKNTEDVGARFAEEARRIFYREAPERAIRGLASQTERDELLEEGIEVLALPLPPSAKEPLQ